MLHAKRCLRGACFACFCDSLLALQMSKIEYEEEQPAADEPRQHEGSEAEQTYRAYKQVRGGPRRYEGHTHSGEDHLFGSASEAQQAKLSKRSSSAVQMHGQEEHKQLKAMEKHEQVARLENLRARVKKQKVTPCWLRICDYFICVICLCRKRMTTMFGNSWPLI